VSFDLDNELRWARETARSAAEQLSRCREYVAEATTSGDGVRIESTRTALMYAEAKMRDADEAVALYADMATHPLDAKTVYMHRSGSGWNKSTVLLHGHLFQVYGGGQNADLCHSPSCRACTGKAAGARFSIDAALAVLEET
jgi:hypothetical protein